MRKGSQVVINTRNGVTYSGTYKGLWRGFIKLHNARLIEPVAKTLDGGLLIPIESANYIQEVRQQK